MLRRNIKDGLIVLFLITGILFVREGLAQSMFSGGSNNGYSSSSAGACAPIRITAVGGSYDGATASISLCTNLPTTLVMPGGANNGFTSSNSGACTLTTVTAKGGSYDGATASISLCSNLPTALVMPGGVVNGFTSSNSGSCSLATITAKGGSFDGSYNTISICPGTQPLTMNGGPNNGFTSNSVGACSRTTIPSIGGSYDGAVASISLCTNLPTVLNMPGGFNNGFTSSNSGVCSATTIPAIGGSYDGSSASISLCSNLPTVLFTPGGNNNGFSTSTFGACSLSAIAAKGGSYDGAIASLTLCNSLRIVSINTANTTCQCNGSASVTVTGGKPFQASYNPPGTLPYIYTWSSGSTTSSTIGLCVGVYYITVTDSLGTKSYGSTSIVQSSSSLATSISSSPATCGNSNGSATVTTTGGTQPYSYSWSNGPNTSSITGLAPGSYTGTVTQAGGCSSVNNTTVNDVAGPSAVNISSQTNVACNGASTGSATTSVSGGTAPFSYIWSTSPVQNTSTATNLAAGSYSITVTDTNGCIQTGLATITEPSAITASASATAILCNGDNATVTVTASGGTGSITGTGNFSVSAGTYNFIVTDANNCTATTSITITQPDAITASASATPILCYGGSSTVTVIASGGTGSITGTGSFSATSGSYGYIVTDANGCTATAFITISEPPAITVSASATTILCNGGNSMVTVSASGGTGFITGTGGFVVSAGAYTFIVTDANGCTASTSGILTEPSAITVTAATITPIQCYGQTTTLAVSASGGTPGYSGTGTFTVSAGNFSYVVTDANGCVASVSGTVTEPSPVNVVITSNSPVCSGSSINLTSAASGGTGGYSYSWSGPSGFSSTDANPVIPNSVLSQTGNYSVTVTDANSCSASTSSFVSVIDCYTTLNLNLYIQGYYQGSGFMQAAMFKEGVSGSNSNQTDTILVALRNAVTPGLTIDSLQTILFRNGSATVNFPPSLAGSSYYIVIKHRNALQTWSKNPVAFTTVTNYNFTAANTQAYGDNMVQVDFSPARWAFYSGDMNQDQNIDLIDFPTLDFGINQGLFGYFRSDLNGDGNTDLLDFPVLDGNINAGVFSRHP